jgi:phage-related protein
LTNIISSEDLGFAYQRLAGVVMPKWILICKSCKFDFQHSQVSYTGMASFYTPLKPELPPGNTCVCPNCGASSDGRRNTCVQFTRRSLKA